MLAWNDTLEATINLGANPPSGSEIERAVGAVIADKVLEITGKVQKEKVASR